MGSSEQVIVVGAGPVGLTTALRLARFGIACTVLEAATAPATDLRASTFHPPTLDMLATMDLAGPLIAKGLVCREWQIRYHETGERLVWKLDILADDTAHPFRLQCEQSRLSALLRNRLAQAPGTTLRFGAAVAAVEQDTSGVVARGRGVDGDPFEVRGRLLVAADGARSTVRAALDMPLLGETYPETTILATTSFPFEAHLEGLSPVNYVWTAEGTYSLLKLPNVWRCSLYPEPGETVEAALMPDSIERKLQRIVPRPERYVVGETRPYRVHRRIAERFRMGRVLLAGDAAHINSPSGGMGMNGGIHDAFALTELIASGWTDDNPAALDAYDRSRRPVAAEEILGQAHDNRMRMQERDPAARRAAFDRLAAIAADPDQHRAFLLRSSMIAGLRRAAELR